MALGTAYKEAISHASGQWLFSCRRSNSAICATGMLRVRQYLATLRNHLGEDPPAGTCVAIAVLHNIATTILGVGGFEGICFVCRSSTPGLGGTAAEPGIPQSHTRHYRLHL